MANAKLTDADLDAAAPGAFDGGPGDNDTLDLSAVTQGLFVDLDVENGAGADVSESGAIRPVGAFGSPTQTLLATVDDFENVVGTEEGDVIFGNAQDNELFGAGGDDRIHAFGGDDLYDGGDGTDTALFNQALFGITANLTQGRVVSGSDVNRLVDIENLNGGQFDDLIIGDRGANLLNGLGGDDRINGRQGDDTLNGGAGDDTLIGERGDDLLLVTEASAADSIGEDRIHGSRGHDRLEVALADEVASDLEIDARRFGAEIERDDSDAADGFEVDAFGVEELAITSGSQDDRFRLDGALNVGVQVAIALNGGADNNDPAGATSADDLITGDTLDLSDARFRRDAEIRVDLDAVNQGALNGNPAPSQDGFLRITEGGREIEIALNDIENIIGSDRGETLFGNNEANVILAGDGDDVLHPFGGVDFVDGGDGTDILLLNAANGGVTIDLAAGTAGANTFVNIENASGSVGFDDVLLGDEGANLLLGNGGNDVLDGRGGDDTLDGGLGQDTLTGGAGEDAFLFSGDAFDGVDVSGAGRQIAGVQDFIEDFDFHDDFYLLDRETFDVGGRVRFEAIDALEAAETGETLRNNVNVVVLLNGDNNDDPTDNSFNAVAAQAQIAGLTDKAGAGFFVYFNEALQVNRLVYSSDLSDAEADLNILSRQTDLVGQDAIDALGQFSADNFVFDFV